MSTIKVQHLSFQYENQESLIFDDVSFVIDSSWKLALIGRNGKGKTTFLKLLNKELRYSGNIDIKENTLYFPFEVNSDTNSYEIYHVKNNEYEDWRLENEVTLLDLDKSILNKPFKILSKGEQTKILLSILFLNNNSYLLIDEPTNHLDSLGRDILAKYLNRKKGFILVSHDRAFIDKCCDHVLSLERNRINIEQGNFSSWYMNKTNNDNYEINTNEKLRKDIKRLKESAKQKESWSNSAEQKKFHPVERGFIDKGYLGHKASKIMKGAKNSQNRMNKAIEEKSKLLKNIEEVDDLKIKQLNNYSGRLVDISSLSIKYNDYKIFDNVNFYVENKDRVQIKGKNGAGKTSIIKLILGDKINYSGNVFIHGNMKFSYISQDTSIVNGKIDDFIEKNNINKTLFKTILRKLDFDRDELIKDINELSEGQKKKIMIAKSLSEEANIYIWDEPLNYIDIYSRMQIEKLIMENKPTLLFIEHDEYFSNKIATKVININT